MKFSIIKKKTTIKEGFNGGTANRNSNKETTITFLGIPVFRYVYTVVNE